MTQSMIEMKIPTPIRTLGATVTIEGELPAFRHGVIYPTWNADVSGSYWGGTGTLEGPVWDSGLAYNVDDVVEKGGLVFLADSSISAGEDPFLGEVSGGNDVDTSPVGFTMAGGRQLFKVSTPVTCTGVSLWGYAPGGGMAHGYRAGITDGTLAVGATTQRYDDYNKLTEGSFQGANGSVGWQHIQFDHPVKLVPATFHQVIHEGSSARPSTILGNGSGVATPTSPVNTLSDWYTGTGYDSDLAGPNADVRLLFELWLTPWDLQAAGIPSVVRDPRFMVYIGPSGLDFDSIDPDAFAEVSLADTTYVGPSSFGGTGPGLTRHCFRVRDIIPALPSNLQSLYIKYAPTNTPGDAPNGVAVYNVTAEAYTPGYELGPHSTSARFY